MKCWWCCLLLCWASVAAAQTGSVAGIDDVQAQQQRIETQRNAALAEFAAQDEQCSHVFAVNDCQAAVQLRRQPVLDELRREEISLHDSQRLKRSQEEWLNLQTKAEDQARAEADAARAAQESQDRLAAQNEKVAQHAQIAASGARRVQAPASAAMTAAERAQNRAAWQQRQAEAAQRRKDLAKRLQEESATPLLPLPPAPAPAASIN